MSTSHPTPVRDDALLSPRRLRLILVLMCAALALEVGANVSLNVALPVLGHELGASQSQLTWVMNAYTLPFAALLLPAGAIADRIGLRTAVCVGLLVFGLSNIATGFVTDASWVIALRVVSALGATLVMPATLSIITRAYPEEKRAKAVGIWAAVAGSGAVLGLLLGGVFMKFFWWGSVLASTGAMALIVAVVALVVVPAYRGRAGTPIDVRGSILFALALGLLVYALIEGPELGWGSWVIVGSLMASAVIAIMFVIAQLRTRLPILDVRLFRSRALSVASIAIILQFAATMGLFLLLPQMLQNVRGFGALEAALGLLPMPVGIAIGSQFAPWVQQRIGDRLAIAGGMALAAAAFVWLGLQGQGTPYWILGIAIAIFGVGFGLSTTPATTMIINAIPEDQKTMAAALNDALREVGAAIGIALLGTFLNAAYRARVTDLSTGMEEGLTERIRDGFGPAQQAAGSLQQMADAILGIARDAFYSGYQVAVYAAAAILVITSLIAVVAGPRGRKKAEPGG